MVFNTPGDQNSFYTVVNQFGDNNSRTKNVLKTRIVELTFSSFNGTASISKCYPAGCATSVAVSNGTVGSTTAAAKVDCVITMPSMANCNPP